jgi:hypothetical protein
MAENAVGPVNGNGGQRVDSCCGISASSGVDSGFNAPGCTVIGICDGTGIGTVTGTESLEQ